MKNIVVIVSGAPPDRNQHDLAIEPGTTPRDIKAALGLPNDYLLSVEGRGEFLADNENVYEAVGDGGKLRATTPAAVGATVINRFGAPPAPRSSWWQRFVAWLTGTVHHDGPSAPAGGVPSPRVHRRAVAGAPSGRTVVSADRAALWAIRRWRQDGPRLTGAYRTKYGAWSGQITLGSRLEFTITDPPRALLSGPHSACFRPRGNGTYFIHVLSRPAPARAGAGCPDLGSWCGAAAHRARRR